MRIKNLPSIESMNGSQDALIIEQTDGSEDKSRKVSPAQIKQYVLGNAIDDIYSVMGQNGAKNLMPYPYYEKTHTENGITWTDNGDGIVTANGTATATSYFAITSRTLGTNMANSLIEGERYTLTGCPTGGSNQKYDIFINETYKGAEVGMAFDYGNGATFTLNHKTETNYGIGLRIRSGQTVSNLTFKPMLRLAADTDDTYQPYAKTNKQLTEVIGDLSQTGLTGDSVAAQLGTAKNQISGRAECFISSSNGTAQSIEIGAIVENRIFLFACGFHTNYVLELIAISSNGANVVHVPVANSGINSISNISYDANSGVVSITVQNNPFGYGRMTRLS